MSSLTRSSMLLAMSALLAVSISSPASAIRSPVTEFPTPTPSSLPIDVIASRDGNIWFTEEHGNQIGRITPAGSTTEFPIPVADSLPVAITAGPDGNVWFTEQGANSIGRINVTGQIKQFVFPLANSEPDGIATGPDGNLWFTGDNLYGIGRLTPSGDFAIFFTRSPAAKIAAGPDGNLWFTDYIDSVIGSISTTGIIRLFPLLTGHTGPWDIAAGPDGNMWFTHLSGTEIGRITPAGVITEFPVGGSASAISGISTGPDGNLWFTESDIGRIGVMTPAGSVTKTYGGATGPLGIALGADGNLWFADASTSAIGRVTAARPQTGYVLVQDRFSPPLRALPGPGATLQWNFLGPREHSVTDASGMGLFDSGAHSFVEYFSFTFTAAGKYPYRDSLNPGMTGLIQVPVNVPSQGSVGQPFTVLWATAPPAPGFVFDVQVDPPGAPGWQFFQHGVTNQSAPYTPQSAGTYGFRARLRGPSARSNWSDPAIIVIT